MRNLIIALATFVSLQANSQDQSNPVEYMEYFSVEYDKILDDMWEFTKTVSHGRNMRKVDKRRLELIRTSNEALAKAKKAEGYNGDTDYKDAVVEYLTEINKVLREDYAELAKMEELAEQSYEDMVEYMEARETASNKQSSASDDLNRAQEKFAAENDIELIDVDNEMAEKMLIADEVYGHYNDVYLIFFRSNISEFHLLKAMNAGDVDALKHWGNKLQSAAEVGAEELANVALYEDDKMLVEATEGLNKFYLKEVQDLEVAIAYYEALDAFNKVKSEFEEIRPKDRTQEDVDTYNDAVNTMNKVSAEFQKVNEENNKMREELVQSWNETSLKFTSKHIPNS